MISDSTPPLLAFAPPKEAMSGPIPLPRVTLRGSALAAVLWTLYAVLYTGVIVSLVGAPFVPVLMGQGMHAFLMGTFSLVPWWLIVRSMAERPASQRLVAHVVALAGYTVIVTAALVGWSWFGGEQAYLWTRSQAGWIAFGTASAYIAQFGLYHAVEASRRSRERQRQAEVLRHLGREQELRTLHSQLNPHFLFNALNTISADVVRDPEGAREAIGQLAGLLRYALDAGRRDLVLLSDEIDFVQDYLALEQARMGHRLDVVLDIAPAALHAEVPPMAVQTLVENAVRHGLAPSREGGSVSVSVQPQADGIKIEVTDTGVGLAAETGQGIGLANSDERLRLLFGADSALRIDTTRPVGFAVSFVLPLPEPVSSARPLSAP